MPDYRRIWRPGGTYFFTITLLERRDNDLLVRHIDTLRAAIRTVRRRYPFHIHAFVVLPEHLHCIHELPEGDADFAVRWMRIKQDSPLPYRKQNGAVKPAAGGRNAASGNAAIGNT